LLENDYNDRCKDLLAFTLTLIPDDPYLLAENLYYSLDNPSEFDRILARLIPLSADEAYRVALVLRDKKHIAQAAKVLEKVVEQRPSWATAWTYLALCYSDTSQWKEAEEKFAKAMMADPNNPFLKESYEKLPKDPRSKAKSFE
jgi:tetratricopeptide (TPR) repeat protein